MSQSDDDNTRTKNDTMCIKTKGDNNILLLVVVAYSELTLNKERAEVFCDNVKRHAQTQDDGHRAQDEEVES